MRRVLVLSIAGLITGCSTMRASPAAYKDAPGKKATALSSGTTAGSSDAQPAAGIEAGKSRKAPEEVLPGGLVGDGEHHAYSAAVPRS